MCLAFSSVSGTQIEESPACLRKLEDRMRLDLGPIGIDLWIRDYHVGQCRAGALC